jgi:hypothetical protein
MVAPVAGFGVLARFGGLQLMLRTDVLEFELPQPLLAWTSQVTGPLVMLAVQLVEVVEQSVTPRLFLAV